ncbi:oxidoreductase [Glycomyces paridis]|uniref:Oxidoreductase n=2 Tax=Glycomyces paridis TaxID=2126555 RepID=A0A4S8PDS2_9ACTN|nr:oxidoreductase [Glycomyces paridis]
MAFVLTLCLWVRFSADPDAAAAAWTVLGLFNDLGVGAVSFAALATGVALGATGPLGVVRHRWVAAKLAVTAAVITGGLVFLRPSVIALTSSPHPGGAYAVLGVGTALGTALLVFAAVLSYARPWGPFRRVAERPVADDRFAVRVRRVVPVAEGVHSIDLVGVHGRLLPPFEAGAHIEIELPSGLVRHYSLCSRPTDRLGYRIAVRRDDAGRGGSREVHRLRPGDLVRISRPRNMFPLSLHPTYLFVAGGIGITPIVAMVLQVDHAGMPWRLVYTGRDRATMAFADQLATTWPANVVLYPTAAFGRPNLVAEVADLSDGTGIYACGPAPLLDALADTVHRVAPHLELHTERFAPGTVREPFELHAKRSAAAVTVGADRSALAALADAGVEVPSDCEIGVCGTCRLRVVEGRPENPSHVPLAVAPDGSPLFYPCVGRAAGRLVVDA